MALRNAVAAPPFFLCRTSLKMHLFYFSHSVFAASLTISLCIVLSFYHTFILSPLIKGVFVFSVCNTASFLHYPSVSLVLYLSLSFFMLINEVAGVLNCCCLKAESCQVGFSDPQHDSGYMRCTYYPPTHPPTHTHTWLHIQSIALLS